jgi:hypothetical protein
MCKLGAANNAHDDRAYLVRRVFRLSDAPHVRTADTASEGPRLAPIARAPSAEARVNVAGSATGMEARTAVSRIKVSSGAAAVDRIPFSPPRNTRRYAPRGRSG